MPPRKPLYSAGERGRNYVALTRHHRDRYLQAEWSEWEERQNPVTGESVRVRRRHRLKLSPECQQDLEKAKRKVDQLAADFGRIAEKEEEAPPPTVSIARLMLDYIKEKTPDKKPKKQKHDRRCGRLFKAFFMAQEEPERRSERAAGSLDRLDWDRFIAWRREGRIPGFPATSGANNIRNDIKWLIAVLNWGAGTRVPGGGMTEFYLPKGISPWRAELRRSQGWVMPVEKAPTKKPMPTELRLQLIPLVTNWQFELILRLTYDSRSRMNQVRQLMWPDVEFTDDGADITWRSETNKSEVEGIVPVADPLIVELLRSAPSRGIGNIPVFPAARNPSEPTSADTCHTWMTRAKGRLIKSLPESERAEMKKRLHRVGYHGERRSAFRDPDFRDLPAKVQELWSRTNYETILKYDDLTVDELREEARRSGLVRNLA